MSPKMREEPGFPPVSRRYAIQMPRPRFCTSTPTKNAHNSMVMCFTRNWSDASFRSFIGRPVMNKKQLSEKSGYPEVAAITLHRLKSRYNGIFANAIKLPGMKGTGGYRVNIVEKT